MELRPYQKECIAEIEKQKGGNLAFMYQWRPSLNASTDIALY